MSKKRVTIKDIANKLDVSYAMINRALNNKSGISDELREKILKTADELGYRINKVAQSMARNTIIIGIVIPTYWHEYFSVLKKGIDSELNILLDYNVSSKYYTISNNNTGRETICALRECIKDKVHGILLCDVFPTGLDKIFAELKDNNIPIVTIGSSPNLNNESLCSVRVDAYHSGKMAAEMLSYLTPKDADFIVFVGNKDNLEHRQKIEGFKECANSYNMNLIGVYETHDDENIALSLLKIIIDKNNTPHGIYSATSNSAAICKFVEDNKSNIKIVSTDVNKEIAEYIKKGIIQCTIFQNLEKHGRTAVRVLYEYLAEHKTNEKTIYITPNLVIKSNLDIYFNDETSQ